jgi:hypothetical protein
MGKSSKAKMQVAEYSMSLHLGICAEADAVLEIIVGEESVWGGTQSQEGSISIYRPAQFGGVKKEGGVVGTAYFLPGGRLQTIPTALAQRFGLTRDTCPGFRGLASIFFVGDSSVGDSWTPIPGTTTGGGGGGGGGTGGGGGEDTWTPPGGSTNCPEVNVPILLANETHTGPGETILAGDLRPGMFVWTQHEYTLEWDADEVTVARTVAGQPSWWVRLTDGRANRYSHGHRFRVEGKGFVRNHDLLPGDRIVGQFGGEVESIADGGLCDVVEITTLWLHTYVTDGLLSHNFKNKDYGVIT